MNSTPASKGTASEGGSSSGIATVHADRFERQGNESMGQTCSGRSLRGNLTRAVPTEWDEWKSVRDVA